MRGLLSDILVSLVIPMIAIGMACNEGIPDTVETIEPPGPECEDTEPCCGAWGHYRPEGEICLLGEESRCSSEDCGGALVTRLIHGRCSGDNAACAGFPEAGAWISTGVCGWDEACDPVSLACVPGPCEVEICGDPEVDKHDLAAPNETPIDATKVLDSNPPVDPCNLLLFWSGTLHDSDDRDWYRFNTDEQEGYDCETFDPTFALTGVPRAQVQFRCWGEGEVAEYDAAEGVFDCEMVDPIVIDGVPLDRALSCRVSDAASITHLRCWSADYGAYYNTAMMILVGVGDDAEHPCAEYTITVAR